MAATDTAPTYSYRSGEVHNFLTRWCFFAAGLTPSFVIAWYIMHVSAAGLPWPNIMTAL